MAAAGVSPAAAATSSSTATVASLAPRLVGRHRGAGRVVSPQRQFHARLHCHARVASAATCRSCGEGSAGAIAAARIRAALSSVSSGLRPGEVSIATLPPIA